MALSELKDDRCPVCNKLRREAGCERLRVYEAPTILDDGQLGMGDFWEVRCLSCQAISRVLHSFTPER